MQMKIRITCALMSLILLLAVIGCSSYSNHGGHPDNTSSSNPQPFFTFTDDTGQEVVLVKKPERVVILNTEVLGLFYQLGGAAIARANASGTPVPDAAKAAEDIGEINQVSLEKVTSLKPDLVIGHPRFHANLKDALVTSQIPLALVNINSYDDIQRTGKLFGQIIGKEAESEKAWKETENHIQTIISKVPNRSLKFAFITIASTGISIQKNGNLALDIANKLNLKNVAEDMQSGQMPSSVPYSIEKLIEADPDYLFMVVYGTEEYGRQKLKDELESNPAWASLRAVKEKRMVFLPSDFVNSPGLKIDQTFEYLAKLVYPDAYEK
ncbi:ABC transporter substrate-binding protein [Brevibacillus formosus]